MAVCLLSLDDSGKQFVEHPTTFQIANSYLLSTDASRVSLACTSDVQAALQLLAVASAQSKSGSIVEQHVVVTILVKLETTNAIELNDSRTVNPAKDRLIQLLIEFRQAAPQEV